MCVDEMDDMKETNDDLIDMDWEYKLRMALLDETFENADRDNVRSQIILRTNEEKSRKVVIKKEEEPKKVR